MKYLAVALPLVAGLVGVALLSASTPPPDPPDTEVRAIIDKALERFAWAEEQAFRARYRHAMVEHARKFDKYGEVEEDEKRVYRVEPVRGVPYARLVSKNGGPIEGDDLKTERERWEDFLETLDADPEEDEEEEDDEEQIVFNDELLERYTAKIEGIRVLLRATELRHLVRAQTRKAPGAPANRPCVEQVHAASSGSTRPPTKSRASISS